MSEPVPAVLTPEGFLAWDARAEGRHEFVDGHVVSLMAGSVRHGVVVTEIARRLSTALLETPCRVHAQDTRLRIGNRFREPDVMIVCGPVGHELYETDAQYLVEVLSPDSVLRDTKDKLTEYARVPSAQQYLVVDPDDMRALLYRRHDLGWYVNEVSGVIEFAGVELDLDGVRAIADAKAPPGAPDPA